MGLIFFALILIFAAILFPEGTRAFVGFVISATVVVVCLGFVLVLVLWGIGALKASSAEPVKKVSLHTTHEWIPPHVVTLNDGTKVHVNGSWSDE